MQEIKYIQVYTGSEVNVSFLENLFEDQNIKSVVKNPYKSGIVSGFHGGEFNSVQLLVDGTQKELAEKIIKDNITSKKSLNFLRLFSFALREI